MFGIKQEKEHKTVSILGIKMKFKSQDRSMFLKNEIYINGERVYKIENENIKIRINGENNIIMLNDIGNGKLIIDLPSNKNSVIEIGKNNFISPWAHVKIVSYPHPGCNFQSGSLYMGDKNIFNGDILFILSDSSDAPIIIGDDNLFAGGIEFHSPADHTIYDINTRKVLNIEQGIRIGNHNWTCQDTKFLNKANILSDCVIGTRSLINKNIPKSNCLIAGIPAEIKREGINWDMLYSPDIVDLN